MKDEDQMNEQEDFLSPKHVRIIEYCFVGKISGMGCINYFYTLGYF